MRSEWETNRAISLYADMIRRICLCHLKNRTDTEDVFQNVFLKYLLYDGQFEDDAHEKAWFIRVSVNACKDHLRRFFRHLSVSYDVLESSALPLPTPQYDVLAEVLSLPEKYRVPIYLYYYEGYSAAEIGEILGRKENTVYSLLSRGRGMLKETLGGNEIVQPDPRSI